MEQNGLPKLVCLLLKQSFPNRSYLSNKRTKEHLLQLLTTVRDLLEFLEDPPRGFAWAAARHTMLEAAPVPRCSVNAQAPAVVPALPASGHQAVQEQCGDVSNLKEFALSVLLRSSDEFPLEACPALLGNIPLAK